MIAEQCLQMFNRRRDLIKIMHWEIEHMQWGEKVLLAATRADENTGDVFPRNAAKRSAGAVRC